MTTDLQTRIAAIKAECEEILKLSEKAHQAPWHTKTEPNRELLMVGQKVLLAAGDFARRDDDIRFIAHARNVSPAMARVCLLAIKYAELQTDNLDAGSELLRHIAKQWEGK